MKVVTTTAILCRNRNRPDAKCRLLARCSRCNRVMKFREKGYLCDACTLKVDGKAVLQNGR